MNWMMIVAALGIMGVLGAVFGVVLSIADKKFAVEVDPRVSAVRAVLGGANCGACGFAGCDAFAESVVNGEAKPDGCPASGAAGAGVCEPRRGHHRFASRRDPEPPDARGGNGAAA